MVYSSSWAWPGLPIAWIVIFATLTDEVLESLTDVFSMIFGLFGQA